MGHRKKSMSSTKLIFASMALLVIVAQAAELKSETTFKPEGCDTARKTKAGDQLSMHYTGTIDESSVTGEKGKQFDSSVGRGPFDFALGQGQVIKGWDQGLLDMCVGEKRELTIPPHLGYGESGAGGDIPGGATLHFEVECLTIGEAAPQPNIFKEIDADSNGSLSKAEIDGWFKEKHGQETPKELWDSEDKDKDGAISWEEFSGPKGDKQE